jgi:glycine cleavage system H protein
MWAMPQNASTYRCGFTSYAVRLLLDIYFLEWFVEVGHEIEPGDEIGGIESKKAESSLCAPLAGTITQFNEQLLEDPSTINVDHYGDGWLFEVESPGDRLLEPEAYLDHLAAVWETTRKILLGRQAT